ncbi:MAG: hypothetical protein AAF850_12870, partial [Pseudomonadota bacterium]
MAIGGLAVLFAAGAAIWLLWRTARGAPIGGEARNVTIFKSVVFLGLVGALFAAKLFTLSLMTLIAAGAVTGIELWRDQTLKTPNAQKSSVPSSGPMKPEQAASILGVALGSDADEIRAA